MKRCMHCGAVLMGFEARGEVCNECLANKAVVQETVSGGWIVVDSFTGDPLTKRGHSFVTADQAQRAADRINAA